MPTLVSIIILNYNWKKFNKDCIESLLIQSYSNFEIIFVDNASIDWSLEEVENLFKEEIISWKIKIVKNINNYGYAEGNNIWVSNANPDSEYIWLLNNDIIADKDALKYLIEPITQDKKIGAVGSLVLDNWSEENIKKMLYIDKKAGYNNYIWESSLRDLTQDELDSWIINATWIGWCSLLYKKSIVQYPFNPTYFAYAEDTYLSFIILLSWYKLIWSLKSIIYHFWSGTAWKQISIFKSFHWTKNQIMNYLIFNSNSNIIKLFPVFFTFQVVKLTSWWFTIRLRWLFKAIWWCIINHKSISKDRERIKLIWKKSWINLIWILSPRIFDNIYFYELPKYKEVILNLLNKFFIIYFKIVRVK